MAEPQLPEFLKTKEKAQDFGLQTLQGIGSSLRMLSESLGAENPLAQKIRGCEEYLETLLSAEAKKDKEKIAQILQAAEKEGAINNVLAGLQAFATAPESLAATALGTAIPHLAGGIWAKAAQLGKAGILTTQATLGAAQGAGAAKGTLYRAVVNELLNHPHLNPEQIEKAAQEAQAYNGKNLDQILLSAGLGGAAAATGAEKILTRLLTREGKTISTPLIQTALKGGLSEATLEGAQGVQQKTTENLGLQREGIQKPTFQGALAQGTLDALAGLALGSGAAAIEIATQKTPTPKTTPTSPIGKLSFDDLETARFQETLAYIDTPTLQANLLTPSPWADDPSQTPTFAHHLAQNGDLDKLPPQCLTPQITEAKDHQGQSVAMLATKNHQTHLVAPHLTPKQLFEQDHNGDTLTHFCTLQRCLDLLPTPPTPQALAIANHQGNAPIHTLFASNQIEKVPPQTLNQTLLTQPNHDGETPILLGAEAGSLKNLQKTRPDLLNKTTLSTQNLEKENIFHKALENGTFQQIPLKNIPPELLKTLLNAPNQQGTTPLQLAQKKQKDNQISDEDLNSLQSLALTPSQSPFNPQKPKAPENTKAPTENQPPNKTPATKPRKPAPLEQGPSM